MQAKDVMTSDVLSVASDAPISVAARLMLDNKISGLPVLDKSGKLVGIVTEGDFLRRAEIGTQRRRQRWIEFLIGPGRLADEYVRASGRTVSDVMTRNVHAVKVDTSLEDIVRIMERHRVKRVPVCAEGKVVGIVTRANLLHALAGVAAEIAPSSAADTEIRENILADLKRQTWAPIARIDVTVRKGVVQLSGVLSDERQRQALRILAENVPGVKEVVDHLVWIEPETGMYLEAPQTE
ncbi:MAG TPA: CBS domain-containing protein [Xanthobacteraceae bacterium]|jgi:CBS-domain-containing membrane protein